MFLLIWWSQCPCEEILKLQFLFGLQDCIQMTPSSIKTYLVYDDCQNVIQVIPNLQCEASHPPPLPLIRRHIRHPLGLQWRQNLRLTSEPRFVAVLCSVVEAAGSKFAKGIQRICQNLTD